MTKKETLKWRLSKLPTSDEVLALIKDGVITKEEGKAILFSTESEEERDEASLKAEIKFLRELVEKLANKQTDRIVETIRLVQKPYYGYGWYKPYDQYVFGSSSGSLLASGTALNNAVNCAFSEIKTF